MSSVDPPDHRPSRRRATSLLAAPPGKERTPPPGAGRPLSPAAESWRTFKDHRVIINRTAPTQTVQPRQNENPINQWQCKPTILPDQTRRNKEKISPKYFIICCASDPPWISMEPMHCGREDNYQSPRRRNLASERERKREREQEIKEGEIQTFPHVNYEYGRESKRDGEQT